MSPFNPFKKKVKQDTPSAEQPMEPRELPAQPEPQSPGEARDKGPGLFARFRAGLKRTSQILNTDIRDLFKQEGRLVDDEFLDRLFALMVRTDMGVNSSRAIREDIQKEFRGRVVTYRASKISCAS
jgi:fused signal recognition particle receptor